jgi:hypothetical protein
MMLDNKSRNPIGKIKRIRSVSYQSKLTFHELKSNKVRQLIEITYYYEIIYTSKIFFNLLSTTFRSEDVS